MPSGVGGFSNVDISGLSNAGFGAGLGNMFTGNTHSKPKQTHEQAKQNKCNYNYLQQ